MTIDDWTSNPTAERSITISDGKAHAWIAIVDVRGRATQRVEMDASQGAVTLAFVRDPDPAKAAQRAAAITATHRFVLSPTDRIHVEQIHRPQKSPTSMAKVAAVLADPEALEEMTQRLAK